MTRYYAGIGSRETPLYVLDRMIAWGRYLGVVGFTLRSGGAIGADTAFENGYDGLNWKHQKQIFLARDSTLYPEWFEHAAKYHPAWGKCSPYAKALHARNSAIMLGIRLNTPVEFVACWTKDGKATGGTGQALRIAEDMKIPVFNWFYPDCEDRLREYLGV